MHPFKNEVTERKVNYAHFVHEVYSYDIWPGIRDHKSMPSPIYMDYIQNFSVLQESLASKLLIKY